MSRRRADLDALNDAFRLVDRPVVRGLSLAPGVIVDLARQAGTFAS